jgi:pilus assembly protein CpaC
MVKLCGMESAMRRPIFFVLVALVLALAPGAALGAHPKIRVTVGQSVTRQLPQNVKTVSIADTKVADVIVAGPKEVLLNGKDIGLTTLVVWDEFNRSQVFDVIVQGPFSDQQIELRVKVAEINRTKAAEFGVDLLGYGAKGTNDPNGDKGVLGSYGGQVDTPSIPLSIFGTGLEGVSSAVEGVSMAFRYLRGDDELQVMMKALMANGVLKLLAEPNVCASSGQNASFLSGGEIPVPIASAGSTGGSTVTIEWKEFGVKVGFLPTIVDSAVINLKVSPEVSSLDFGNGIQLSGFRVPALRTRKAETTVELKDGEVLVIGGLIMEEETKVVSKIPLLGHLPLLGWFFTDYSSGKQQTELLLVVSPKITRAYPAGSAMPDLRTKD